MDDDELFLNAGETQPPEQSEKEKQLNSSSGAKKQPKKQILNPQPNVKIVDLQHNLLANAHLQQSQPSDAMLQLGMHPQQQLIGENGQRVDPETLRSQLKASNKAKMYADDDELGF